MNSYNNSSSENIRTFLQRHQENQEPCIYSSSPVLLFHPGVALQTSLSSVCRPLNHVPESFNSSMMVVPVTPPRRLNLLKHRADSGAFSATHSSEKYQDHDVLDSHRSEVINLIHSDLATTPRDFVGLTETNSTLACDSTPRDQSNNSDTGINMKFTIREDELMSTSNTFTSNATLGDPYCIRCDP
ncbi:unnamed protein product [Mytilus coruscus]|uniref:Uncharacterized protein n=1 Tax=Mytilus coruscus TaxID=42192 RepID=A0A6J8C5Y9_MYTCO|nr:unnamed protein product [Mytilus coruscus]